MLTRLWYPGFKRGGGEEGAIIEKDYADDDDGIYFDPEESRQDISPILQFKYKREAPERKSKYDAESSDFLI